jgi:hypothetical protein
MSSWLSCVGTECLNCNLTDDPDEMDPFDSLRLYARVHTGAAKRMPNFEGSDLGRFPLVSADFRTSGPLPERCRRVDAFLPKARAGNTSVEATSRPRSTSARRTSTTATTSRWATCGT